MSDWFITPCQAADLPAAVALINSAYRGESSQAGWTTEADYIGGPRTTLERLTADLAADPSQCLLLLRQAPAGEILACALVQPVGEAGAYIGMVTVKPGLQAGGLGRVILAAAEDQARAWGARAAQMTVVSLRDPLIAWYQRRGYGLTGERRPFPYGDPQVGEPKRDDLEFVVLEKSLAEAG